MYNLVNKKPLTREEDDIIVYYRNDGYGWAEIARHINETFNTKRTPNQLKNNYNQRLVKTYPNVIRNSITRNKSMKILKPMLPTVPKLR